MPRYSFQVRTDGTALGRSAALEYDSFDQMLDLAIKTMTAQDLREADLALKLAQSVLEIVDEDGDVVASLPIGAAISRHWPQ